MSRGTRPLRKHGRGDAEPPADAAPPGPQARDVLLQRTARIEPTYAVHVLQTFPPTDPPALTCHGLRQAIQHANAIAREQIVDIWYTEDGAYCVRLVRYRGGSPSAAGRGEADSSALL
jgi:hypothetical protein